MALGMFRSPFQMGYGSIIWYIISALVFFIPFSLMVTEFGSAFNAEKGGIYTWMEKSVGPSFAMIGTLMWYMSMGYLVCLCR